MRAIFLLVCLCSCGGVAGSAPVAERAPARPPHPPVTSSPTRAPLSRDLAPDVTFGDLVRAVRAIESRGEGASEAGCLFSARAGALRLEADLAPGVQPLPEPWDDVDGSLSRSGAPVEVLSRWGRSAEARSELRLVAFTTTEPWPHDAAVLVVTDQGSYLRHEVNLTEAHGSMPTSDACRAASGVSRHVYVAAENDVPVATISSLLGCFDEADVEVALSTFLPAATRLPEAPVSASSSACAATAPADDLGGTLTRQELLSGIAPFRSSAGACLRAATTATVGGALTIRMRITPEGRVGTACIQRDGIGDPGVTACVLSLASALAFPAPHPGGSVDLELPIRLVSDRSLRQRALCESTRTPAMQ